MGENDQLILKSVGGVLKDRFARLNERMARYEKEKQPVSADNSLVAQAIQQLAGAIKEQNRVLEKVAAASVENAKALADLLKTIKDRKKRTYRGKIGDEPWSVNEE